jgi:hypothetical protein
MTMFAVQSATRMPLRIRRVRRLAPIALALFPLGFVSMAVSRVPSLGFTLGLAAELIGFGLMLVIQLTGSNQIAAGLEQGLDEFEMNARLRAQSDAYRWYGTFVAMLLTTALLASLFGYRLSTGDDCFIGLFFWVTGYSGILPGWFLARRLRDSPADE